MMEFGRSRQYLECGDVTPLSFVFPFFFPCSGERKERTKTRETKESGVTSPHSKSSHRSAMAWKR
jgi:hypothetical protein